MSETEPQSETSTSNLNPLVGQLQRDLQSSGPWAHRFQQLAGAIMKTEAPSIEMVCEDFQSVLDIYVDDERAGRDVRARYPDVWQHLQTCANCRQDHDLLLDMLRDTYEPAVTFPRPSAPLSFLRPERDDRRWVSRLRSRLAGASPGLEIIFNLDYLRSLFGLTPLQPASVYRTEDLDLTDGPRTLLIDDIPFDGQRLNVDIKVKQSAALADQLMLEATLTSTADLPENLWLRLTWAGQTHRALVHRIHDDVGRVQIEGVSLAQVRQTLDDPAARFAILLEAHDVSAVDEHTD